MIDVPGMKVEPVASTNDEATFSVIVNGNDLGTVAFVKYYEPRAEACDGYVALWAGPTLCVIDREQGTMRCVERDDETHRIHLFGTMWVVEGELNVDLFDPTTGKTLATYNHNEVITKSAVTHGLVHIEDFAGSTVTLDAGSLQVVGRGSTESDPRSH